MGWRGGTAISVLLAPLEWKSFIPRPSCRWCFSMLRARPQVMYVYRLVRNLPLLWWETRSSSLSPQVGSLPEGWDLAREVSGWVAFR